MLIQGYERARARMLIPLRVSFAFSFNPAPSHQHCFKLSRVERSLFVLKKREKEKKNRQRTIRILCPLAFSLKTQRSLQEHQSMPCLKRYFSL